MLAHTRFPLQLAVLAECGHAVRSDGSGNLVVSPRGSQQSGTSLAFSPLWPENRGGENNNKASYFSCCRLSREQSVVPSVGLTTTAWRQEVMRESVQDPAASTLASVASSAVAVRLDGTGSLTLSHHHNNRRVCEMQMG